MTSLLKTQGNFYSKILLFFISRQVAISHPIVDTVYTTFTHNKPEIMNEVPLSRNYENNFIYERKLCVSTILTFNNIPELYD